MGTLPATGEERVQLLLKRLDAQDEVLNKVAESLTTIAQAVVTQAESHERLKFDLNVTLTRLLRDVQNLGLINLPAPRLGGGEVWGGVSPSIGAGMAEKH